jgi:hypothetical protein
MSSINISQQNIYGKCDLKCSYNFKYQESNLTATNNQVMISLKYDSSNIPPVTYNNEKYIINKIDLVSPSLHNFDGNKAIAELLIEHTPEKGGNLLLVCIPFIKSGDTTTAGNLLTQVINKVASNAPRNGETTDVNIQNFSLQNIIPLKPFYNYTNDKTDYIVYSINYAIPITESTLNTLTKIIKPFPLRLMGDKLFYNSKGPNTTGSDIGDGIYISCKPTDVTEEKMNVIIDTNNTNYDLNQIFKSEGFQVAFMVIMSLFLFIIIFYLISYGYTYLIDSNVNIPKFSFMKT